jgi:penicillin-binding protein 2
MENCPINVFSAPGGSRSGLSGSASHGSGGAPAGRLVWLFVAFAIPLAAVAARLVQLQCFFAENYVAAFETTTESVEAIPSTDGRIYAADGRVLAEDLERYNISVHYRWIEDPPNEHWLTRQALVGLSRSERRNRERVAAQRKKILAIRDALWARLSELSGLSPPTLAERRAAIQERVERIAARLAEKQAAREAEVSDEPARLDPAGSTLRRIWNQLAAALTTPPRREADDPIVAREALDYHPVIQDVALDIRAQIEAHPRLFPGVRVGCLSRRVYYDSAFAPHVVGARVPVTAAELASAEPAASGDRGSAAAQSADVSGEADPLDYRPGDRIGRTGVEAAYDSHLHGLRGLRRITRNRYGEIVREETIRSPRPGASIELTLNTQVQRKMEQLLDAALKSPPAGASSTGDAAAPLGGAVVALDVQSGAVFVLASGPRFDFGSVGIPDASTWKRLNDDPRRPLFHRAIQSALPPGSVFKVLSAVALLQSRKVDPDARFECRGYLDRPDRFRCLIYAQQKIGHGPVDLSEALSRSCNVYFFQAADRIGPQPLVDWAGRFGIGCPTGIDLPFEKVGHLPEPVAGRWHPGDTRALAVGQSSLTVTPLQIARVMAAVANGGDLITPFVARRSGPKLADEEAASSLSRRVPIPGLSDGTLARIRAALEKTVADPSGTGYSTVRMKDISIAGKSGTAQAGKGQADHAWFAGYAPADNPRVAFAVVLEHAGSGSKSAGPLARQLVEALLADGVLQPERVTLRE